MSGQLHGLLLYGYVLTMADESPYEPYYEVSDHASMALCEGRHSIPQAEDGSIFWEHHQSA